MKARAASASLSALAPRAKKRTAVMGGLLSVALGVTLCGIAGGVVACHYDQPVDPGPPYRAEVLSAIEVKEPGERPSYSVGPQTLNLLTDLKAMDGRFFKLVFGGELQVSDIVGSQVSRPIFTGGRTPLLRYNVEDGVIVPRDYSTLAMLSSYHQFELMIGQLESLTGLKADDFLSQLGKLKILFEPKISISGDSVESSVILKLNAAYGDKQFILFRRSALESVPIGLNLQVIAHEFGHALFGLSFFRNESNDCERFEREFVVKGMNEGFADTVSWAVTGSADVLANSIDISSVSNPRNFANVSFDFNDLLLPSGLSSDSKCDGGIYCIGTLFAGSVLQAHKDLGKTNGQADRHATLRAVYGALSGSRTTMEQLPRDLLPSPPESVTNCSSDTEMELATDYQIKMTSAFLRSFVENVPAEWKAPLCTSFGDRFGTFGFSSAARAGVCP